LGRTGYRSISLKTGTHTKLEEASKLLHKTIPETVLFLVEEFLKPKESGP
jgi:hypothetical protein